MAFNRIAGAVGLLVCLGGCLSFAQTRSGGSTGSSRSSAPPPPSVSSGTAPTSLFIRGKIVLDTGTVPAEPIVIERVCNGAVRKEGYTDFKGNFEFELGKGDTGRDATESGRDVFQNSGNRGPTQGMGSDYGISMPGSSPSTITTRPELLGCELRASLPGYRSSSVILRADGNSWEFNVGTILLSRLENVKGSTISTTTMTAPVSARRAFEKGEKALAAKKFDESEKELRQAVEIYPTFARAWAMLGDVHRQQNKLPDAKEDYSKGIAADSQFVNPYFGMTVIAIHEKDWEEALKYSNRVLEINAAAFSLNYMYNAAANYYLGNLPAAEASAHRFKELDTDHRYPDSSLLLSNIFLAKRDYDGAAKELEEYLRLVPAANNAAQINEQIKQLHDMRIVKQ